VLRPCAADRVNGMISHLASLSSDKLIISFAPKTLARVNAAASTLVDTGLKARLVSALALKTNI